MYHKNTRKNIVFNFNKNTQINLIFLVNERKTRTRNGRYLYMKILRVQKSRVFIHEIRSKEMNNHL